MLKQIIDAKGYAKDIRLFAVARHQAAEGLLGLGMLGRFASDCNDQELADKLDAVMAQLSEIIELID